MRNIVFILSICFLAYNASAQHPEVGLSLGLSFYQGDLDADNFVKNFRYVRPGAGVFGRYNFSDYVSARVNFNFAQVTADDANEDRARNLNFKSRILEFGLTAEFNILGYQPYGLYKVFSPFVFVGIAGFSFNPKGELDGEWYELQPLGTEGQGLSQYPESEPYSKFAFAIPFGVGAKYALNDKINLGIMLGHRYTFTGYLDDVSTTYVSDAEMLEGKGELAAALANKSGSPVRTGDQRGNGSTNDWYFIGEIFVSYNFLDNGLVGSRRRSGRRKGCYN